MWEQISLNNRRTTILVVAMALVLIALGYVIGEAFAPGAGLFGLLVALGVWFVMTATAFVQGDNIMLAVAGAKRIEKQDHLQLFNVVEEMAIASGQGGIMPSVYVVDDMAMNAFAVGRDPKKAAVAVTAGLLANLDRDELQGVVAHEMAHVKNRDVLLMTMLGVMLGAIVIISEVFLRSMRYGGTPGRHSSNRRGGGGGGQAAIIAFVIALVFAILAPILARLIYFAVSRRREFLADASAAVFTRYPAGLASALQKLGGNTAPLARANHATAPMYIVNPFVASFSGIFASHPPIADRIRILNAMGKTVSFRAYEEAWGGVRGKRGGHLPKSALAADAPTEARSPSEALEMPRERLRNAGDLLRKAHNFLFIPCVCGLRVKLPPEYRKDRATCPRCKRELHVPMAQVQVEGETAAAQIVSVRHQPGTWQSFKCECGKTQTLAPSFSAARVRCSACGKTIQIA